MMATDVSGKSKTAIASGLQIGLGKPGGIITSLIFPAVAAPLYKIGLCSLPGIVGYGGDAGDGVCGGAEDGDWEEEKGKRDYRLRLPQHEVCSLRDDHPNCSLVN